MYRAWDSEDRPLYVGCTGNIKQRRANHRSTSEWFKYAVRFDMIGPFEKAAGLVKEQEHILSLRPLFNALPEHAMETRRRSRRLSELQDRMLTEAGLATKEDVYAALLDDSKMLHPIWAAAEAIVDHEFDLRCTHMGRIKHYELLLENEVAA